MVPCVAAGSADGGGFGARMRIDYKPAVPASAPARSAIVAIAAIVIAGVLLPFDRAISDALSSLPLRGDVRRELHVLQQFGSGSTIALVAILIALLDRPRLRRMLDYLLAAGAVWLAVFAVKVGAGRMRPKHDEPFVFLGPFRSAPTGGAPAMPDSPLGSEAPLYSWQFWRRGASELWSMPSSHTALAVVAAVFLSALYPRLRPLVFAWCVLVGFCRMTFDAHYPSDIIVGAAIAWLIARPLVRSFAGVRLLDRVWLKFIDRTATPALPRMIAADQRA